MGRVREQRLGSNRDRDSKFASICVVRHAVGGQSRCKDSEVRRVADMKFFSIVSLDLSEQVSHTLSLLEAEIKKVRLEILNTCPAPYANTQMALPPESLGMDRTRETPRGNWKT